MPVVQHLSHENHQKDRCCLGVLGRWPFNPYLTTPERSCCFYVGGVVRFDFMNQVSWREVCQKYIDQPCNAENWNRCIYIGVSKNRGGPPKSSILIGFSIINHPFWGVLLLFLETSIYNLRLCENIGVVPTSPQGLVVPTVFVAYIVFNLGILGHNLPINTHYSLAFIFRDFPWRGAHVGGTGYIQPSPENSIGP